jgi:hypothetical protein
LENRLPQACSTVVLVKAISRPPSTMAVKMARIVTTTELPSSTASSTTRLNGGRLSPLLRSSWGTGAGAGAGACSLTSVS